MGGLLRDSVPLTLVAETCYRNALFYLSQKRDRKGFNQKPLGNFCAERAARSIKVLMLLYVRVIIDPEYHDARVVLGGSGAL